MTPLKSKTFKFFIITVGVGFIMLFLNLYLTGSAVSWFLSICSLLIVGFGFFIPSRWWLWPIGLYLGGLIYLTCREFLTNDENGWLGFGAAVLALYTIIPMYILCAIGRGMRFILTTEVKKDNL